GVVPFVFSQAAGARTPEGDNEIGEEETKDGQQRGIVSATDCHGAVRAYPWATGDLPSMVRNLTLPGAFTSRGVITIKHTGTPPTNSRAMEADSAVLGALMASPRKMRPIQYCLYCASVMWYTVCNRTSRSRVPAAGTINTTGMLLFQERGSSRKTRRISYSERFATRRSRLATTATAPAS